MGSPFLTGERRATTGVCQSSRTEREYSRGDHDRAGARHAPNHGAAQAGGTRYHLHGPDQLYGGDVPHRRPPEAGGSKPEAHTQPACHLGPERLPQGDAEGPANGPNLHMNYGYRRFRWVPPHHCGDRGPGNLRHQGWARVIPEWHLPTTFAGGNSNAGTLGNNARIEVYFSPKGGCTESLVRELGKATNAVLVQAYRAHLPSRLRRRWLMQQRSGAPVCRHPGSEPEHTEGPRSRFSSPTAECPHRMDSVHPITTQQDDNIDGAVVIHRQL